MPPGCSDPARPRVLARSRPPGRAKTGRDSRYGRATGPITYCEKALLSRRVVAWRCCPRDYPLITHRRQPKQLVVHMSSLASNLAITRVLCSVEHPESFCDSFGTHSGIRSASASVLYSAPLGPTSTVFFNFNQEILLFELPDFGCCGSWACGDMRYHHRHLEVSWSH